MKRLLVTLLLAASPAAFADTATPTAAPAPSKAGPGTAVVKQANETISTQLKQKVKAGSPEEKALAAKVTASVRSFLDIDMLGQRSMVDNWSTLKKAEQDQFLSLLRALIEDNYIRGLRANVAYKVEYTGESTDANGNIIVTTVVKAERKGRPFSIGIDYVLVKDGDKLRAFDIKTDGVGLVENYRLQFTKIIKKDGFPALIEKMKKKQAAT